MTSSSSFDDAPRDVPERPDHATDQNARHSERSEEPYAKRRDVGDSRPAETSLHQADTEDTFNQGLERLLTGDMSGLDNIDPELHETVLGMASLARTAGWLGQGQSGQHLLDGPMTPSASIPVSKDKGRIPSHFGTRATGTREVTMQDNATITAQPPIARRSQKTHRHIAPRIPVHRMAWSGAANIALAILIVIAGFGAWRIFDGGMFDGGNGPAPSKGNYAFAPTTPVPAATAEPRNAVTSCDFSEEVPVYNGVDEPPVAGTVLYVTTSHDLMLRCDEEPEDVLLAQDVDYAGPTHWPGVVNLGIGEDAYEPTPAFLNVLTNARLEYGRENSAMTRQGTMNMTGRSPFVVTAMPDDSSTWALTDLRSMETRSLDDLGDVDWPRNSDVYLAENGVQGTYALAVYNPSLTLDEGPALLQPDGFPGEIMLVTGSLNDVTWIDVPDDLTSPYSIHVSPDGEHVAIMDVPRPESPGEATIVVLRASDGAELARTDTFAYTELPNIIWVSGGEALVYLRSGALMMLEATEGSSPQPLLESSDRLFALSATHNPEVVTVSESGAPETEWQGESDRVYAVDTRTGSVETFEGDTWRAGAIGITAWQVQSVIILIDPEESEHGSTRVIDPSTGEKLLTVPFAPTQDDAAPNTYRNSFPADTLALSADRGTTAFTMRDHRTVIVANISGEDAEAREVPFPEFTPPAREWSAQVHLSPNGSAVQLTAYTNQMNMQWVLDLTDPQSTWVEIPENVWVDYMPAMP